MKPALRAFAFLLQFVIVGLALAFVITRLWPDAADRLRGNVDSAHAIAAAPPTTTGNPRSSGPVSYSDAVARAAPAVLNIYANKMVTTRQRLLYPDPVMQRLFGGISVGPSFQRREQSLGSGVIVSADGYVLTNNHVIARADDIQVLLYDGRVAQAQVVGGDEDTDLAVLKIDASNLPTVSIAEDTPPSVGDVVLAIGNPLGLGKTVTMGIVSAIGRQLSQWAYEDFIQTDAAINTGNSGGALVNARGELVGINTAFPSPAYGAEGIGFAIPVATARKVLEQIRTHGQVIRGWLGAEYGPVAVQANSGLPGAPRGAQVLDVYPRSPAAQAGIQAGDVLLKFDGKEILDPVELRNREAAIAPGTQVHVSGLRAGITFEVDATLLQRPVLNRLQIPTS
ncbi:MAG: trypsin-like peptidase domain-containing protein [Tahibacter sp.]